MHGQVTTQQSTVVNNRQVKNDLYFRHSYPWVGARQEDLQSVVSSSLAFGGLDNQGLTTRPRLPQQAGHDFCLGYYWVGTYAFKSSQLTVYAWLLKQLWHIGLKCNKNYFLNVWEKLIAISLVGHTGKSNITQCHDLKFVVISFHL